MIHKVLVLVLSVSNNMVLLLQAVLIEAIREKQQCPEHIFFMCSAQKSYQPEKNKPLNVSFEIYHLVSKLVMNVWIMSTLIILCNVFFYESIINQLFVFILFQ